MKWGILGALDAEIALIKSNMLVQESKEVYGTTFFSGYIGRQQAVVACCGVGTVNAAACTSVMIREFGAKSVVNIGIAGSASKDLHLLDVAISSEVLFHDADLQILQKYYPFKSSFPADNALQKLAVQAVEALSPHSFRHKVGRIASGDAYVTDSHRKEDIVRRCSPICIEMEGAAVGQVAYMNNVPFLVIRSISDNADETAAETYDNFLEKAAEHSSTILLKMLELGQYK